jgi:TonB-linked SusC/RagA family outer membrane protein
MRKVLMLMMGLFVLCTQLFAQNRTITGRVMNEKGEGIPNASVSVKGTKLGTITSTSGDFSITVPSNASTLVISSVNYQLQEVSIRNQSAVNVSMQASDQSMAEVIVTVPYGTVKKTSFTGSEGTVTAKTLQKQQVTSVTKALEGQVAGIITTNGGGGPGSGASIMIRGVGSVNASSSPLYVLDGTPYDGSISALNTDDIETVSVLKDAAATALFGARGANGIIMITTKKGRKGTPAISAKVNKGYMTRLIPEYDRLAPQQYYEMMWESIRNSYFYRTNGVSYGQAGINASNELVTNLGGYNSYNVPNNALVDSVTGKLNPNARLLYQDSWEDALYRSAARTNATLSISGANDRTDYLISGGYLDEEGILKFSDYKRYNARVKLNAQATNWLKTGLGIDGAVISQANVPTGGTATTNPFYYSRQMGPIYPVYVHDATGKIVIDPVTGGNKLDWGKTPARPYAPNSNLLGSLALDDRSNKTFNGNANPYAEIKFLKDFTLKTALGLNFFTRFSTTYQNSQFGDAENVKGRSTKTAEQQVSYTLNEVLNWNKLLGKHSIRALVGHENYKLKYNNYNTTRTGFPFPGTSELDNASVTEGSGSYEDNHRIESYFSGVNYEYNNRYLLSASFRRDGTSRFSDSSRWGNFYSAGIGWRISQESFFNNIHWLNDLKLRASYGEQGNESVGTYYAYQNLYSLGWNNANRPGATVNTVPGNPDLIWEGNKTLNVGIDFAVLRNRVFGTLEYFNRISSNLIFNVDQPGSLGQNYISKNVGELSNKGVELTLGASVIRKAGFDWRVDLNLTHFTNVINKMPPTQPEIVSGSKKLSNGHGIYDFWLKEFAGVDPSTGKSLYYRDILDVNGKTTGQRNLTDSFSKASYYYSGSALPDIIGGITNSFSYKNFDLSFLVTFEYGGKFLDQNYQSLMHSGAYGTAWHEDILKRWQKPGDITNVPRVQNALGDNEGTSTRFLFDASWMNIKNISLSYTLPKSAYSRWGISGVQFVGTVDNAFLFTTKKGMDPQRSFNGTSDWSYTPYRTISFGLNVNL